MRMELLMFDGIAEADIVLPKGVLAKARLAGADVKPVLVTIDGRDTVVGCYGTRFAGLQRSEPERTGVLIVAGGWIDELLAEGTVARYLAEAKDRNPQLVLAAVCSGALLFGAAGLLKGERHATTYRPDHEVLKQWADVVDARIVDDGDIITSGSGWLSGLDLPLYLIDHVLGLPALAVDIEQRIGHDRRGTVWRSNETGPPERVSG